MADDAEKTAGTSVGEATYRRIRTDILFGRLAPGGKLGLERLRETYGTGLSTLRELLNRLASEGLVVAEGARGFEVAPVSPAEFQELAELRLLLEGHALEQSFAAGDLDWEAGVVAAHHKLSAIEQRLLAGGSADAEQWKRYDWEFHHALIAACRSEVLLSAHAAAYDRYLRYQMVAVVFRGEVAMKEHRELLRHAIERDSAGARRVLTDHLNACVEHVVATGGLARFNHERGRHPADRSPDVAASASRRKVPKPNGRYARPGVQAKRGSTPRT